jgi:hypothetical protein
MEENVAPGSTGYMVVLGLLLFSRGMDFLSTWVATPNLVLEANPIARRLGWKWGGLVNILVCLVLASWPLPAVVVITTSLLVASRNFKSAWMMRSLGEDRYRFWISDVLAETGTKLFIGCMMGETVLVLLVGAAVVLLSDERGVPFAIGIGIMAYAIAVAFYTLLSVWRRRRRTF